MHIFVQNRQPDNIYTTKWCNGTKNGSTVWSGKNLVRLIHVGVTSINSPVIHIAFRHCICYNVNFLLSFLTVIVPLACSLECDIKIYGQVQKTSDNILFDY